EYMQQNGSSDSAALQQTADSLVEYMRDPRFKDSRFLEFVRRLRDGDLEIQGSQVFDKHASAAVIHPSRLRSDVLYDSSVDFDRTSISLQACPDTSARMMPADVGEWVEEYRANVAVLSDAADEAWEQVDKMWYGVESIGLGYSAAEKYNVYAFLSYNPYL